MKLLASAATIFCASTVAAHSADLAQDLMPAITYPGANLVSVISGCSAGNPMFRVTNAHSSETKVRICRTQRWPGNFNRTFYNVTIPANGKRDLGCLVEGGYKRQDFTIHWSNWASETPRTPPTDVSSYLDITPLTCSGNGCSYQFRNAHFFKPLTVHFTFRGRRDVLRLRERSIGTALGFSNSAPVVTQVDFWVPYPNAECLAPGDNHPNIPSIPGP